MQNDMTTALSSMVEPLLWWYEQNKRPLPWRTDPTPYHVWLSEIMLQQTRIEAVLPYYARFLAECPTVARLAAVDDDRLLKLWEGLGYYSRARNLKKAALTVMQNGGEMPATYKGLLSLPGVGAYTAGAIASIAYGLPEPAVDGNVLRVITRLCGITDDITLPATKEAITCALRKVYPTEPTAASALTQAWMELGETVCIPTGAPRCADCPLGILCRARAEDKTDVIPVRSPKKPRRVLSRTLFLLWCDGKVAIRKRPPHGLLAGLYEIPGFDEPLSPDALTDRLTEAGLRVLNTLPAGAATHVFTHIEWHMEGYHVRLALPSPDYVWVTPEELAASYALPSAFRAFLKDLSNPFAKGE